jgi:hypothetical protein
MINPAQAKKQKYWKQILFIAFAVFVSLASMSVLGVLAIFLAYYLHKFYIKGESW